MESVVIFPRLCRLRLPSPTQGKSAQNFIEKVLGYFAPYPHQAELQISLHLLQGRNLPASCADPCGFLQSEWCGMLT
jgi:hypothetical protein